MLRKFLRLVVCASVLAAACDDKKSTPPTPDPGVPSGTEKITGTERLGWDQEAASGEELATFRYLIYVDAVATEAQGVSCSETPGPAGYSCSSRMPPITPGQHVLSMSAYISTDSGRLESGRSASVTVFLAAQSTAVIGADQTLTVTTSDGVQLHGVVVADGLRDPTDLAPAPDGRIFIAERAGRIRVFRDGHVQPSRAITLPDATVNDGQGLLALAVDPQYEHNHFLYTVYTTVTGFRLARLRVVGDAIGDRAVLMDGVPSGASDPAAVLRFGPDGKLFVGFDDGGEPRRAGDLGSFNGKILRLNSDATTPADQPGWSPVFAANINAPRGLDWDSTGRALWVADGAESGLLDAHAGPGTPPVRYALPNGSSPTALAVYRGDLISQFRGDLFVATSGGHALLRVRLDAADPRKIVSSEQMLGDAVERARAIAVGYDGALYLATDSVLLRFSP